MEKEVYIDSNIFILAVINNGKEGTKAKSFLRLIVEKNVRAYTSTLTFDEFSYKLLKNIEREEALRAISAFFSLQNLKLIDVTQNVIWNAFELMKKYNIQPRDAIHIACAINNNLKVIVSEDKDFDKIKEIKRLSLSNIKV